MCEFEDCDLDDNVAINDHGSPVVWGPQRFCYYHALEAILDKLSGTDILRALRNRQVWDNRS